MSTYDPNGQKRTDPESTDNDQTCPKCGKRVLAIRTRGPSDYRLSCGCRVGPMTVQEFAFDGDQTARADGGAVVEDASDEDVRAAVGDGEHTGLKSFDEIRHADEIVYVGPTLDDSRFATPKAFNQPFRFRHISAPGTLCCETKHGVQRYLVPEHPANDPQCWRLATEVSDDE